MVSQQITILLEKRLKTENLIDMRSLFLLICLCITQGTYAQDVLTFEQYMDWVRSYHPVASQADVTLRFGEQDLLAARGGFDPFVYADYYAKRYKGLLYYDRREYGVNVPTWGGVELRGLVEQNTGALLNPENEVPDDGLVAVGASVNLGQGLFIDNRRRALRQAQIYVESTKAERDQILNDLHLDANRAYWDWASAYQNVQILKEGVELAQERFEMVKESYIQGDFPAIDTVEAYTQIMDRIVRLQDVQIEFVRATQLVNTYLWDQEQEPIELSPQVVPENVLNELLFDYSKDSLREYIELHPELRMNDFEIETLEVERRFRAEMLKPVLRVNYNFLAETFGQLPQSPFLENNYKMGITFGTPLFLRRERGNLGFTKARIDFQNYRRDLRFQRLKANLESEIFNYETIDEQLRVFYNNVNGLQALLDGETRRFEIGESSLFLVNAREVSVIDARIRLNNIAARRKTAYARMLNSAGLGFELQ